MYIQVRALLVAAIRLDTAMVYIQVYMYIYMSVYMYTYVHMIVYIYINMCIFI